MGQRVTSREHVGGLRALGLLVALAALACGPGTSSNDAGKTDAGHDADSGVVSDGGDDTDAGFDGGPVDGGPVDGGPVDGGNVDAGDAGPRDGGTRVAVSMEISPQGQTVFLGSTLQLAATVHFSDDSTTTVTNTANWSSSDTRIADVVSGTVTPHALGAITATAKSNGLMMSTTVTVVSAPLVSITVAPNTTTVVAGLTKQLVATARFGDGHTANVTTTATWSSDNEAKATVSSDGLVTTRAQGAATITASIGAISGSSLVTVDPPTPVSVAVTPQGGSVPVGLTLPLAATATLTDRTTRDVTATASWMSTANAVVSSAGVVTGRTQGSATVTATLGALAGTTNVNVTPRVLQSLVVTSAAPSFVLGGNVQLKAMGTWSDGATTDITTSVTWASVNPEVARVTSAGLVTGVAAGDARLTATSGTISEGTNITVFPATLSSIAVTGAQTSFPLGRSIQLTATGTYSDTTQRDISTEVTWSAGTGSIAQVSSAGLVTGVTPGVVPVTATLSGKTGSLTITVAQKALVSIAIAPPNPQIPLGSSLDLKVIATFTDTTTSDITANSTWESLNTTTASITVGGKITARSQGQATIRATFGGLTATTLVTVTPPILASLVIAPDTFSVKPGLTQQLVATGTKTDTTTSDVTSQVTWTSSDETLATVSPTGLVTAVDSGTATIRATSGTITNTATITVLPRLVSIAITPANPAFPLGLGQQLKATGTFLDAHEEDLTSTAIWTTLDGEIASVSNSGLVGSVAPGTTTITATVGRISGTTDVQVEPPALVSLAISPLQDSVPLGLTTDFKVDGTYTDGSVLDLTDSLLWSSSLPGVATVSNGAIHTVSQGTTTITATAPGGLTVSATLTVTDPLLVSIAVTPPTTAIPWGFTVQLAARGTYTDASEQDLTSIVAWTSSLSATTVSTAGLVSTHGVGTSVITATSGAISGTAQVQVDPPELTGLSVTPDSRGTPLGVETLFSAQGSYTNGTTQNLTNVVTWTSSDETKATISTTGLVSSLAEGTVTLTASFGGFSDTGTLLVQPPALTAITLSPTAPRMPLGRTVQLTATGSYTDHIDRDITATVSWSSDDTGIAYVANGGELQSSGVGITNVTASQQGVSAHLEVTIDPEELVSLAISPLDSDTPKGTTLAMTASGTFTNGDVRNLTSTATWTSSDDAIVAFETPGNAHALVIGLATVSATIGEFVASTDLTVTAEELTTIVIAPADSHIAKGTSQALTATGHYTDTSTQDLTSTATWASSAPAVASVDSTGLAFGAAEGTATISATFSTVTGSTLLTVDAHTLTSIALSPENASTPKGVAVRIVATGTYSDAVEGNISSQAVWTTSNSSVATVSGGLVQAVGEGSATITATLAGISVSTGITVQPHALVSVAVTPTSVTKPLGLTAALTATATYTDGVTENVTATATWESSNTGIATVAAGNVQTVAAGPATITATFGAFSASSALTVGQPELLSIDVTPASSTFAKGLTAQLTATGHYTDIDRDLTATATWTSNSTPIASVVAGLVKGQGVGPATITAKSGAISGTAGVTVTAAELVSIAVTASSNTIPRGASQPLVATGTYTDDTTLDITSQSTWTSFDTSKATVNSSGVVKAVEIGNAVIRATKGNISAEIVVTVGPAALVSVAVTPNRSLRFEETQQMVATGTYTDGTTRTETALWSVTPNSVASINTAGLLTANNPTDPTVATVMAAVQVDEQTVVTGTVDITIAALKSVKILPENPSVALGLTTQLTAIAVFTNDAERDVTSQALWNIGLEQGGLELQNQKGVVQAIRPHDGDIEAFYLSETGSTRVTVGLPSSITLSPIGTAGTPITFHQGETLQFTVIGTFGSSTRNITTFVDWKSDRENCIPVYEGVAEANQTCDAVQIAAIAGSGTARTKFSYLTALPPIAGPPRPTRAISASLRVSAASTFVPVGTQTQLMATRTGVDGSTTDVSSSVTWKSSDETIATVSSSGAASGVAFGSAHVTATDSTGLSAYVDLSVTPATLSSVEVVASPSDPLQLAALGTLTDGSQVDLSEQVLWQVSDPTVATISTSGRLTVVSAGEVTVTALVDGLSGMLTVALQ